MVLRQAVRLPGTAAMGVRYNPRAGTLEQGLAEVTTRASGGFISVQTTPDTSSYSLFLKLHDNPVTQPRDLLLQDTQHTPTSGRRSRGQGQGRGMSC